MESCLPTQDPVPLSLEPGFLFSRAGTWNLRPALGRTAHRVPLQSLAAGVHRRSRLRVRLNVVPVTDDEGEGRGTEIVFEVIFLHALKCVCVGFKYTLCIRPKARAPPPRAPGRAVRRAGGRRALPGERGPPCRAAPVSLPASL